MVNGQVEPAREDGTGLEARITVNIVGANLAFQALEVVVDTGYTGWMSLPESIINEIGFDYVGMRPATLANGQTIPAAAYNAGLLWHGQPVDVVVQALDSKPMVGAELLAGSRLTIDWWDGGEVIVEERTPPTH